MAKVEVETKEDETKEENDFGDRLTKLESNLEKLASSAVTTETVEGLFTKQSESFQEMLNGINQKKEDEDKSENEILQDKVSDLETQFEQEKSNREAAEDKVRTSDHKSKFRERASKKNVQEDLLPSFVEQYTSKTKYTNEGDLNFGDSSEEDFFKDIYENEPSWFKPATKVNTDPTENGGESSTSKFSRKERVELMRTEEGRKKLREEKDN